jgi:hypothetical protein
MKGAGSMTMSIKKQLLNYLLVGAAMLLWYDYTDGLKI